MIVVCSSAFFSLSLLDSVPTTQTISHILGRAAENFTEPACSLVLLSASGKEEASWLLLIPDGGVPQSQVWDQVVL